MNLALPKAGGRFMPPVHCFAGMFARLEWEAPHGLYLSYAGKGGNGCEL